MPFQLLETADDDGEYDAEYVGIDPLNLRKGGEKAREDADS